LCKGLAVAKPPVRGYLGAALSSLARPSGRGSVSGVVWSAVALLASAFALLLATPSPAGAADPTTPEQPPAGFFGVSGRHLDFADLNAMDDAGVGIYRTLFHFSLAKPHQNGIYDWTELDKLVGRTAAHDIQLLPLLFGTPKWISPHAAVPPIYSASARAAWSRLLSQMTNRYGPRGAYWRLHPLAHYHPITAWQIWNEPNSSSFWGSNPNPTQYAQLVALSADAIHRVDPHATIVSAGLVANPEGLHTIPGPEYLAALSSQPAARAAIDKYGYHPYAENAPGVRDALLAAREALAANDPGAPIWVTEVGWGSDFLLGNILLKTPEGQAQALRSTFSMILRKRKRFGVQRALWYYWRDQPDPFCLWCRSAGLLEPDHSTKPAYAAFRRLANGN
jgi:hypothetical protein